MKVSKFIADLAGDIPVPDGDVLPITFDYTIVRLGKTLCTNDTSST